MTQVDKHAFSMLLAAKGLSQAELARRVGLHTSALSNILSRKRKLKIEEAARIARELSIDIEKVMDIFDSSEKNKGSIFNIKVHGEISSGDDIDFYLEYMDVYLPNYQIYSTSVKFNETVIMIKGDFLSPRYRDGEFISFHNLENDHVDLISTMRDMDFSEISGEPSIEISDDIPDDAWFDFAYRKSVYYHYHDPLNYEGREVIVALKGNRKAVKRIFKTSDSGKFVLVSANPSNPPIIDEVEWVSPIEWHLTR